MSEQTRQLYVFGPFCFYPAEQLLLREGKPVPLSPKVTDTLLILVQNAGHLVDKDDLMKSVWPHTFVEEGNLNKNISILRKTLGQWDGGLEYIETVPKRGYRFVFPLHDLEPSPPHEEQAVGAPATEVAGPKAHWKLGATIFSGALTLSLAFLLTWRMAVRRPAIATEPRVSSLAVLPLENLSGDASQDYFADGMTDELITSLGQIGSIRVISRTSVMRYKGVHKPLLQIGRELNVDAVVEGTVLRFGDHVRITAQLIQVRSDQHLWAHSYQGDMRDVLALQSQVASAVAGEIRVKLTPQRQTALKSSRVVTPEAYEAYLRALGQSQTIDGLQQSVAYFDQALKKEPDYPEAHAGLGHAYMMLGHMLALRPQEAFPRAKAEALKALQFDESLAEAHQLLATTMFLYDWDFPHAEREFQRAIALNPNSTNAHAGYSDFLNAMGRPDEAIAERVRIRQIDPLSLSAIEGIGFEQYWAGRFDLAIENARSVLGVAPNDHRARLCLGLSLEQKHQFRAAIEELQKAVDLSNDKMWIAFVAHAKGLAGDKAGAKKILDDLQALSQKTYVSPWVLAIIYPDLGEKDQAFFWLEKCYQDREHDLVFSKVWPMFNSLRSDSRFQDLMRRVGVPQ